MFGKRPANAPEADHREHSLRSSVSLVAAVVLFGLGAVGLYSVLPYSISHDDDPLLLVTSPSQTPEAAVSATARDVPGGSLTNEAIPDSTEIAPEATAEPVAAVFAVGVTDLGVSQLTPLPDPPTPTPTETPTETATPTPAETPVPTPNSGGSPQPNFIPDSREPGPIKPVEPITAYFDPAFQQPAPEAPFSAPGGSRFPVTP